MANGTYKEQHTACVRFQLPMKRYRPENQPIRHLSSRETKRRRKRKLTGGEKKEIVERKEIIWILYGGLCQRNWQRGKQ
uniref:Uncharacterized protein n=1 Tax=Daphnia magna TaxID=35525 RepID=A0A0P6E7X7_9CRUS